MANRSLIGHGSVIAQLESEKHYKVRYTRDKIFLTKMIAKKPVTFTLVRDVEQKGYVMLPCNYTFHSTISHFDYCIDESRFTRNKSVIKSFLRTLQGSFVWEYIVNKDTFLKVNTLNRKSKKEEMRKQLGEMTT